MKPVPLLTALIISCTFFAASVFAAGQSDIQLHKNCKTCGMSREMFAYSRVLIEYGNGNVSGTCSIRCASVDLALNMGRTVDTIKVGDFNSKQLIDAGKAVWVIGGTKQGTMSSRGKWAFAKKEDADKFIAGNGGKTGSFQDALKASFDDLYTDLKTFWDDLKKKKQD